MNCCDEYGKCTQGLNCPVRESRRVKAYPHVPADIDHDDDIQTSNGMDKKLAWASWALVWTIVFLLAASLVILFLEIL